MVRPSEAEIADLKRVAREIRDSVDEFGYRVDLAVGQHETFSHTRGPASALERTLVLEAARRGASQAGLQFEEVSGGLNIVTMSGDTIRRYRLKSMKLKADGTFEVICGEGSALLVSEPNSLFREERWILGFITSDDHTVEHLIAAEIVDRRGSGPYQLVLGPIIDLNHHRPPTGFTSTDEELPGFEEDDEDDQGKDASGF